MISQAGRAATISDIIFLLGTSYRKNPHTFLRSRHQGVSVFHLSSCITYLGPYALCLISHCFTFPLFPKEKGENQEKKREWNTSSDSNLKWNKINILVVSLAVFLRRMGVEIKTYSNIYVDFAENACLTQTINLL